MSVSLDLRTFSVFWHANKRQENLPNKELNLLMEWLSQPLIFTTKTSVPLSKREQWYLFLLSTWWQVHLCLPPPLRWQRWEAKLHLRAPTTPRAAWISCPTGSVGPKFRPPCAPQTIVRRSSSDDPLISGGEKRRLVGRLSRASAITWCNDSAGSASWKQSAIRLWDVGRAHTGSAIRVVLGWWWEGRGVLLLLLTHARTFGRGKQVCSR